MGPSVARVLIHRPNILDWSNLVGHCVSEYLLIFFIQDEGAIHRELLSGRHWLSIVVVTALERDGLLQLKGIALRGLVGKLYHVLDVGRGHDYRARVVVQLSIWLYVHG